VFKEGIGSEMGNKFIPGEDIVVSICDEQIKTVK
jgi:hypothetical protein